MSRPTEPPVIHDAEQLKATKPDTVLLTSEAAARYKKRELAIDMFLAGARPAEIESACGIPRQEMHRLRNRFFAPREDGFPYGYEALLDNTRIGAYTRRATPESKKSRYRGGYSGCFMQLMAKFKKVFTKLNSRIDGKPVGEVAAAGVNVKAVHRAWLEDLEAAGAKRDAWPFTTKNLGYNTVGQHVRDYLRKSTTARLRKYGRDAMALEDAHSLKRGWITPGAWDVACYDEQMFPAIGTITINVDGQEHEVAADRFTLCVLCHEGSRAVVGYHIAYTKRVAAADFLETFSRCLRRWKPREFKAMPNLTYRPGAGFPSMIPGFLENARISYLKVDNDLTHYANVVLEYLRKKLGLHIQFGEEGRPVVRYAIEQIFSQLQSSLVGIPSTTGSGPADPKKNDPGAQAIKHHITIDELEELVEVLIANLNAKPREELRGATALEYLRRECTSAEGIGSVIPGLNPATLNDLPLPVGVVKVTIRGNLKRSEAPHVHMDGADYTSDLLRANWELCNRPAIAHLHRDHRIMRLFTLDGRALGAVEATGHWSHSYHESSTRKEIRNLVKNGLIKIERHDDPVQVARRYWAAKAAARAATKPKKIAPEAHHLMRADRGIHQPGTSHVVTTKQPADFHALGKGRGAAWRVARKIRGADDAS